MLHYVLEDLLYTNEQRRLELIKYLWKNEKTVSHQELTDILTCNFKTLKNDIDYINQHFFDICLIHCDRNKKIKLQMNYHDRHLLLSAFFYSVPCVQILESLLREELDVKTISRRFDISPSTCYGYLNQIRKYLEKFHLKLERKGLVVKGSEKGFRKLIFSMEYIGHAKRDRYERLSEELVEIIRFFGFTYAPTFKRELSVMLKCVIHRTTQGNYIKIDKEICKKVQEHLIYKELCISLKVLLSEKEILLPEAEYIYLFMYLICNVNNSMKEESQVTTISEEDLYIYRAAGSLKKELEEVLPIQPLNTPTLFVELLTFLKNRYIDLRYIPRNDFFIHVNEIRGNQLGRMESTRRPNIVNVEKVIERWAIEHHLNYFEQEDVEKVKVILENYYIQEWYQEDVYQVLVCISKGPEWERYIQTVLKKILGKESICVYFHHEITQEDLSQKRFDLAIIDIRVDFGINADRLLIIDTTDNHISFMKSIKKINYERAI